MKRINKTVKKEGMLWREWRVNERRIVVVMYLLRLLSGRAERKNEKYMLRMKMGECLCKTDILSVYVCVCLYVKNKYVCVLLNLI